MSTITTLVKNSTTILYQMPLGKPNPNEPCPLRDQPDLRSRVVQKEQKENTCVYYIFARLRMRIGKNYDPNLEAGRTIEKIFSNLRKKVTDIEEKTSKIRNCAASMLSKVLDNFEFKTELSFSPQEKLLFNELCDQVPEDWTAELLNNFLEKKTEPFVRKELLLHIDCLKELGTSVQQMLYKWQQNFKGYQGITAAELLAKPASFQKPVLAGFVQELMAEKYGLIKSAWDPSKGIEGLIDSLKKEGPLAIKGFFGMVYYTANAFEQSVDGKAQVFGWKKGTRRPSNDQNYAMGHICLVVGARKEVDKSYVFFIDPKDRSDPSNPNSQKIYVMSYETFLNNLSNQHTLKYSNNPDSRIPYAYAGCHLKIEPLPTPVTRAAS